jgi:hypothetical protein
MDKPDLAVKILHSVEGYVFYSKHVRNSFK